MSTKRVLLCLLLILNLTALPTLVQAGTLTPPEWVSLGAADAEATGWYHDLWVSGYIYLRTTSGFRMFNPPAILDWTLYEDPGTPGRELTAVARIPYMYDRPDYLIARSGADGHGTIEYGRYGNENPIVFTASGGAVADLEMPSMGNVAVACTRALGQTPGEVVSSPDAGSTWSELTGHGHADPTDLFFFSTDEFLVSGDAGVMYTPDHGTTWQAVNDGLPSQDVLGLWTMDATLLPMQGVPDDTRWPPAYWYAAMSDGVYCRPDGATTWQRILEVPSPRRIEVARSGGAKTASAVFVVSDDGGLYITRQGTWNWEEVTGDALGADIIDAVYEFGYVYAVTDGAGVFSRKIWSPNEQVPVPLAGSTRFAAAPNPFNATTTLSVEADRPGPARLTIHDLRGRQIATLFDGQLDTEPRQFSWRPRKLGSGVYLAHLVVNGETSTCRLVLVE